MKITYTRVGDYYLPNLVAPEKPQGMPLGNAAVQLFKETS